MPGPSRRNVVIALLAVALALAVARDLGEEGLGDGARTQGFVWLALAAALLATGRVLWNGWRTEKPPWWASSGLVALFVAGLALRLTVSPRTLLHEGYHAEFLDQYLHAWDNAVPYGDAGPAIYAVVAAILGRGPDAVFLSNAVLAALTVPAVGLLDFALFKRWPRALVAAAVAAFLPLHLRFSASEDLSIPFTFFLAWACASAARWADEGSEASLWAMLATTALAAQARPESLAAPLFVVGLVFALGKARRLWSRHGLAFAIGVMVLVAPHLVAVFGRSPDRMPLEVRFDTPWAFAFARTEITPVLVMGLGVVGAAAGLARSPRIHAWILALGGAYLCVSHYLLLDFPHLNFRSQVVLTIPAALLCASAFALTDFASNSGVFVRRSTALALVAALAASAVALFPAVRAVGDQQEEFAFLRATLPELPHAFRLLTVVGSGKGLAGAFPAVLLEDAQKQVERLDLGRAISTGEWPAPGPELLYYRGMSCHTATPEARAAPLNPACAAVSENYELEPVRVHEVTSPPYNSLQYLEKPWEIGFYRLSARKSPARP